MDRRVWEMKINKVHCLFEQSGTFKNEFKKLGFDAEDYDLKNEFGQTDHVIDLFSEIDRAYDGKPSLFDSIGERDLVFAFFPCTRFEAYNPANFQGMNSGMKNWSEEDKLKYSMSLHEELHDMYTKISKLFCIALRGGWRMVVENPYTQPHYLTMYFPIKPKIIDKDRSENGDYFVKPTQFWFVNFDPQQNFVIEPVTYNDVGTKDKPPKMRGCEGKHYQTKRSMISREYARRFILMRIIEDDVTGIVIANKG